MPLTTMVTGTPAKASDANANWSLCVLTDTAKTISVTHVWAATQQFTTLTASRPVYTDASQNLVSATVTGTGSVVQSVSPTITGTLVLAAATASGLISGSAGLTISAGTSALQAITGTTLVLSSGLTVSAGTTAVQALTAADGLVGSPTHSFTSETGLGMYRAASGRIGFGSLGSLCLGVDLVSGVFVLNTGFQVGSPVGGNKGTGNINIAGDIYKNNTAYTNPDYALEWWATGGTIDRFKKNLGAADYLKRGGRLSIAQLEAYVRKEFHLPGVPMARGAFERHDVLLEKVEELATYIIEQHHEIQSLKQRLAV